MRTDKARIIIMAVLIAVLLVVQLFVIPTMVSTANSVLSVSGFVLAVINAGVIAVCVHKTIKLYVGTLK